MFNDIFLTDDYFTNGNMLPADDGDDLSGGDSTDSPTPTAPILSGQPAAAPAMPITGQDPSQVTPPAPAAPQAPDANAEYSTDVQAPAMPISGGMASNPNIPLPKNSRATIGVSADGQSTIPQAAGQPSVWKSLVMGALMGAVAGAGGKGFGQGMSRGGAAVQDQQDRQQQQQQNQQKLVFQSVEAANSAIRLRNETKLADMSVQESQAKLDEQHQAANDWAEAHFQPKPYTISGNSSTDTQAQAGGMLQTLSNANGGSIPIVTGTTSTKGQGTSPDKHDINIYAPTGADLDTTQGQQGATDAINIARKVQNPNSTTLSFDQIKQLGAQENPKDPRAGVQALWARSQQAIIGKPQLASTGTTDERNYANSSQLANMDQELATYKASPDADKSTVAALQARRDAFAAQVEGARNYYVNNANETTIGEAPAKAEAARQEDVAKQNTPQGQATLEKTRVETQKAQYELSQQRKDDNAVQTPDVTGFTSQLSKNEYDKRYDKFTGSPQMKTLGTLQGSYQQFQDTLNHISTTGDMTGAESVVGLFNAIGISATPLAGKGFRINQNTVAEHTEARGIDQAAYQKLLKLKDGDVITPKQLQDYSNIASGVYYHAYVNAADEAHRQGLPADFLPKGGGQAPDRTTIQIYTDVVAHANPKLAGDPAALKAAAKQAAVNNGWKVQ